MIETCTDHIPVQSTGSTERKYGGSWQLGQQELLDTIGFAASFVSYLRACNKFCKAAWSAWATRPQPFHADDTDVARSLWRQCLKTCHPVKCRRFRKSRFEAPKSQQPSEGIELCGCCFDIFHWGSVIKCHRGPDTISTCINCEGSQVLHVPPYNSDKSAVMIIIMMEPMLEQVTEWTAWTLNQLNPEALPWHTSSYCDAWSIEPWKSSRDGPMSDRLHQCLYHLVSIILKYDDVCCTSGHVCWTYRHVHCDYFSRDKQALNLHPTLRWNGWHVDSRDNLRVSAKDE